MHVLRKVILAAVCSAGLAAAATPVLAETTLRAVMHSDLKILDPIWTTAYIVRNHGYMIYDTLLAQDEKGAVKPQMVEKYETAPDNKSYTFTLREGLLWHDGKPVTSEDCIASIKRWAVKDSVGQKMMTFVDSIDAVDAKTFTIKLKEPTGLVLLGLSKPSSNVPFMMPKRVADTDPNKQIEDFTGSGPFVFVRDEWKPGDKTVYVKFDKYKPRAEPASGLAGGKVVKVDRVEWRAISDAQQAINALSKGEIDFVEQPSHDLLGTLKKDPNVDIVVSPMLKAQYVFRPNTLHKPFDNPKIRQAVGYAVNRQAIVDAFFGETGVVLKNWTPPGTKFAKDLAIPDYDVNKAKQLIQESGVTNLAFDFWYPSDVSRPYMPDVKGEFEAIQRDLEAAGFKPNPKTKPWRPDYLAEESSGKYPMWLIGWNCDWLGIDNFLFTAFFGYRDNKPNVEFGYKNDAMNAAMVAALKASDDATQQQNWDKAQDEMAKDLPTLPIVSGKTPTAGSTKVHGFVPSPTLLEFFSSVWVE
jgi:peptide/nickel transport system substrate-binding protein